MGWWFFAPRLPCIWRPICWRRFFFPKKSTFYKAQPETLPNKPSHRNVARCTVGRHLFRVVLAGGLLLCQFSGSHFPSFFMDPENRTRSSHFLKEHRRNAMLTVHAFGNRVLTADLESSPAPLWGLLSKLPDDDFRPFQSRRKPLDLCGRHFFWRNEVLL